MQNTTTLGENQRNGLYPSSQAAFEEAVRTARMLPSMRPASITASRKRKLQTLPWSLREVTQSAVLCSLLPLLLARLGPLRLPTPPRITHTSHQSWHWLLQGPDCLREGLF